MSRARKATVETPAEAKASAVDEAIVEAAIAALRESPGAIPVDTLRSLSEVQGFGKEDAMGKAFEVDADDLVTVYSTYDGTSSRINTSMLAKVLRKRFTRDHDVTPAFYGRLAFSIDQKVKPRRGTLKCLLHPDHPLREEYVALGIPPTMVCMKANIPDEYNKMLHERNRHKTALEIVSRANAVSEANEKRDYDRKMLAAILELLTQNKGATSAAQDNNS